MIQTPLSYMGFAFPFYRSLYKPEFFYIYALDRQGIF
jgi:hypothetical protein